MTTDASVYRIVTDIHTVNTDLREQINELLAVADVLYGAISNAVDAGAIPQHATECSCKLCKAIDEYKVFKWKMTQ
jgi:hypothetical protein